MEDLDLSNNEAAAGSLPDDLLPEIFDRLPVKTASRLRCVSQQWNLLIVEARQRLPPPTSGLFYRCHDSWSLFQFVPGCGCPEADDAAAAFVATARITRVLDSCNGLLLCQTFDNPDSLFLCNPLMKRGSLINNGPNAKTMTVTALVFDPSLSQHYKVVAINQRKKKKKNKKKNKKYIQTVTVFSSETGKWSECVELAGQYTGRFLPRRGFYCHGVMHWLCSFGMVTIDIERMTCRRVEFPDTPGWDLHIWKSAGRLRCTWQMAIDGEISIWDMEDGGEWVLKRYVVPLKKWLEVVCFHPDDNNVVFVITGRKLMWCNLTSSALVELGCSSLIEGDVGPVYACTGEMMDS